MKQILVGQLSAGDKITFDKWPPTYHMTVVTARTDYRADRFPRVIIDGYDVHGNAMSVTTVRALRATVLD